MSEEQFKKTMILQTLFVNICKNYVTIQCYHLLNKNLTFACLEDRIVLKHVFFLNLDHINEWLSMFRSYENIIPKELPIVQEITTVLREWGTLSKQLYMV